VHVLVRALSDNRHGDAARYELFVMIAQLRDVPAAERSAVVAKEDERERAARPESGKVDAFSIESEDERVRRSLADLWMHAPSVSDSTREGELSLSLSLIGYRSKIGALTCLRARHNVWFAL
jgi:hypothetical protein